MWARDMELTLGLWLVLSPFILRHDATEKLLWSHDLGVGALIVVLATACYVRSLRRAHLLLLAVAGWLIGLGWWSTWQVDSIEVAAAYQNWLLVGLLLVVFAIVPSDASRPPPGWRADG